MGHPVDIPCRSFVNLKSNKSSMKLIEFFNQSSLVLLNGRKIGDTSSKLTCCSTVDIIEMCLGTCIILYIDSVWLSDYFPVEMCQVIGTTISVRSHMEKDEFTA